MRTRMTLGPTLEQSDSFFSRRSFLTCISLSSSCFTWDMIRSRRAEQETHLEQLPELLHVSLLGLQFVFELRSVPDLCLDFLSSQQHWAGGGARLEEGGRFRAAKARPHGAYFLEAL